MHLTQSEHDAAYTIVVIETLSQTCTWIYAHSCSCGLIVFILLRGLNVLLCKG